MCGLVGIIGIDDSAYETFISLLNLQHRGQDGAGILALDTDKRQFNVQKGSGLVENVFSERSFRLLKGQISLGHTRYATIGHRDPNLLQPFLDSTSGIAIAHNGNIVNCYTLKEELLSLNPATTFGSESDSEIILKLLVSCLAGQHATKDNLFAAISGAMSKLVGSYAVIGLSQDGSLFGFRDPNGIRPLFFGRKKTSSGFAYALASETAALNYLAYTDIQEVAPAEIIVISQTGQVTRKQLPSTSYSPCMFEWIYFARVESKFGDMSVYQARFNLGLILAEEIKRQGIVADVVLPVPETSRIAAVAIAEALDIPFRELLIKNRYVNRTFILDGEATRQEAIKRKLFPVAEEIAGKRCLIVDDSIVRGNTAKQIIHLVRQSGAKDITLVSTCPPISSPCYYGIDFPSPSELIAYDRNSEDIARVLGADKIIYQTIDGLKAALKQKSLCLGCLTKEYPTDVSCGSHFEEKRKQDRNKQLSETT